MDSTIMTFNDFIKNKNVVFVGPAPTLIDKNKGEWIDAFDVVVRTNGSIFLLDNEDYRRDYGTKCDVLYSNVQFHREMGPFPITDWKNRLGLKYLNMKTSSPRVMNMYNSVVPSRTVMHIIQEMMQTVPGLLMGPIIIEDLLRQAPRYLSITGFDFYHSKPTEFIPGDYREYYPNYLPAKITTKADILNVGRKDMHDQYHNTKYIYDLFKEGKIMVDETMRKIMTEIIEHPQNYTNEGKYK